MLPCGEKRGKLDMYHLTVAPVAILVAKSPPKIAKTNRLEKIPDQAFCGSLAPKTQKNSKNF